MLAMITINAQSMIFALTEPVPARKKTVMTTSRARRIPAATRRDVKTFRTAVPVMTVILARRIPAALKDAATRRFRGRNSYAAISASRKARVLRTDAIPRRKRFVTVNAFPKIFAVRITNATIKFPAPAMSATARTIACFRPIVLPDKAAMPLKINALPLLRLAI